MTGRRAGCRVSGRYMDIVRVSRAHLRHLVAHRLLPRVARPLAETCLRLAVVRVCLFEEIALGRRDQQPDRNDSPPGAV